MGVLILGIVGSGEVIQANVLSPMDMLVVGIIAIMLFGNRLPEVARSLGRSMSEFKKGMQDLESEVKTSLHSVTSQRPTYPEPFRSSNHADELISRTSVAAVTNETIQPSTADGASANPSQAAETAARSA